MKLLIDENISYRVVKALVKLYPESVHVKKTDKAVKSDIDIFFYAKKHGFTIVTFDEDFYDIQLLHGPPRKSSG